jgi:hypothetical protein
MSAFRQEVARITIEFAERERRTRQAYRGVYGATWERPVDPVEDVYRWLRGESDSPW